MNNIIEKIKFKKVVIIYITLLTGVFLIISIFLGNIYNDKLKILYNYYKLTEVFEDNNDKEKLQKAIKNLNNSSKDIIDVTLYEDATTDNFYKDELTSINNTNNYYTDINNNIYKLDTKKEFILDIFNIKKENKNDYYNEFQIKFNKDNKYTINYLKNNNDNEIIILSKISLVKDGEKYLKISMSILLLLFMLYWIICTLMIYQNALKLKINAYFWGILTLLTNVLGIIIYIIYTKNRTIYKSCEEKK